MKLKYLKSEDLSQIKLCKKKKRVLLINPKMRDSPMKFPHNGLAILAGILKKRGHDVLVVDYAFLPDNKKKDISYFYNSFKPDVVGVSMYTQNSDYGENIIRKITELSPNTPIMVGGPHALMHHESLQKNKNIDYIFVGEAELTIISVVEIAKKEKTARIIQSDEILKLNYVPLPEYKSFYEWQTITEYPIMTSRGCPNKCSFCVSICFAHRFWRPRNPEQCIKELEIAKKEMSPNLRFVVFDDCPTVDKERFNKFLELYIKKINSELSIVNTRADSIDEKMLSLMKKCPLRFLSIGVEHGNPEVFKMVNKGETFEQIENACKLIKKQGIRLGVSFIIGLPGDSFEKTMDSIRFYKKLGAEQLSLNLMMPYKNTVARDWFEKNGGKFYDEFESGKTIAHPLQCPKAMVETPGFTAFQRKKAFYMFLFKVAEPRLKLRYMPRIITIAGKYGLLQEFLFWIPHGVITSIKNKYRLFKIGLYFYKKRGFSGLINKIIKSI